MFWIIFSVFVVFVLGFVLWGIFGTHKESGTVITTTSDNVAKIAPDETSPIATLTGWKFKNRVEGSKINWYFINDVGRALIKDAWVVFTQHGDNLPFFSVYTHPVSKTNGWYGTRQTFQIPPGESNIKYNETVLIYIGSDPSSVRSDIPHLKLALTETVGSGGDTDNVMAVAFGTNSGDAPDSVDLTVSSAGYTMEGKKPQLFLLH
jgi:hypothetical protein